MNSIKRLKPNPVVEVGVQLTDILTQKLCAQIIIEFVKFIIYQKQLIPYPLERLKLCISKKKSQEAVELLNLKLEVLKLRTFDRLGPVLPPWVECQLTVKYWVHFSPTRTQPKMELDLLSSTAQSHLLRYRANKHFKKTVNSLDILDQLFHSIISELESCEQTDLKEVVILLGATTLSPQNVFRIKIPRIENQHLEKHHPSKKQLCNLLRSLLSTTAFADLMCQDIHSKNLFIFLGVDSRYIVKSSCFVRKEHFSLPLRAKQSIINIFSCSDKNIRSCCCLGVQIFNDSSICAIPEHSNAISTKSVLQENITKESSLVETCWYQYKLPFTGFKDEKVNGMSVTDVWLRSN